ncbi:MAG TPA: hypothetical protein VGJ03_06995 [Acidimicrobiales bacterium]
MALTHLVDTSVITRLRHRHVRSVVEPLAAAGSRARAGITDLEIGYSARSAKEWDLSFEALDAFELIETSVDDVRRARQVQRLLATQSLASASSGWCRRAPSAEPSVGRQSAHARSGSTEPPRPWLRRRRSAAS